MIDATSARFGNACLMRRRRGTHQSSVLSEMSSQFHDEWSAAPGRFFIDSCDESASARRNLVFGPTTLTTGCSPIVLVTTPPHPASNARRMLDSDSVGGADDSRNGLRKRSPVKVIERSMVIPVPGSEFSVLSSTDGSLDQPIGLIGGDKYLIRIIETKRLQIDEQMMPVRQ